MFRVIEFYVILISLTGELKYASSNAYPQKLIKMNVNSNENNFLILMTQLQSTYPFK